MDIEKRIEYLQKIKNRYKTLKPNDHRGIVTHHGDCKIFKADHAHCSCGLIHDLTPLLNPELLYADFVEDEVISDNGGKLPHHRFQSEADVFMEELYQSFEKPSNKSDAIIESAIKDEIKAVGRVFGKEYLPNRSKLR